jgi:hypothetical protein
LTQKALFQHWLPQKKTEWCLLCKYAYNSFEECYLESRPELLTKWFLLLENARMHIIAHVVMKILADISGTSVEHPPYSPDLAPTWFLGITNT